MINLYLKLKGLQVQYMLGLPENGTPIETGYLPGGSGPIWATPTLLHGKLRALAPKREATAKISTLPPLISLVNLSKALPIKIPS
jgi:hypothetical protein